MPGLSNQTLKEFALTEAGADLIGIANVERFDGCPPEHHPHRLNQRARSVIVLGLRILRGAMRGLEQGTGRVAYNAFGYGGINRNYMPDVMFRLGRFIEDRGFEAVPTIQWTGMPPLEPIMDHRLAACAAGLGEIGHSKIVLTDRFGPFQRFGVLLTDAELEPDPIPRPHLCDDCMACVRDCPVKAIGREKTEPIVIDGVEFRWGKLDVFLCGLGHCGAHETTTPYLPPEGYDISRELAEAREKLQAATTDIERRAIAEQAAVVIKKKYHHPIHLITFNIGGSRAMCGARGCMRPCLVHLERQGKLSRKFARPFREKGQTPQPMDTFTEQASNATCQMADDE